MQIYNSKTGSQNTLFVKINDESNKGNISIYNAIGKLMKRVSVVGNSFENQIDINLKPGTYIAKYQSANTNLCKKFLIL